jgi:dephospho-CoA kinase
MIRVGITGGVASGKSVVAQRLAQHGAMVLNADRVGHEVLGESEVRQAIRERWGEAVFDADGQVDRRKLAQRVFAPPPEGPEELAALERITHPRIGRRLHQQIEEEQRASRSPMLVLDAAVMTKAGWDRLCDRVLFVDCPRRIRLARAKLRGWTEAEFTAREAAQEPVDAKRRCADLTVDNSASLKHVFSQVDRIWNELVGRPTRPQ